MGKKQQKEEKEQKTEIKKKRVKKEKVRKEKKVISGKQILLTFLVILVIVLAYLGIAFRGWTVSKDTVFRHIRDYRINTFLSAEDFNGTILIAKEGDIVFAKSYGNVDGTRGEDGKKFDVDTIYPIFSLTKQFTAYAILQLEQDGKLSREDHLSKYFKDYKYGDELTIDDLLRMESGIPEYIHDMPEEETVGPVNREELLSKILSYDLEGKGVNEYSNSNYFLLGCIIEQVSGMTYEDYIQQYVVDVADMGEVRFDPQKAQTKGFTPHFSEGMDNAEFSQSVTFAAGEMCTSAISLYRWEKFLFSDASILDYSAFEEKSESVYNLGLVKSNGDFGHSGGGIYHRHYVNYNKDRDTMVIVLSNSQGCNASFIAKMLDEIFMDYYTWEDLTWKDLKLQNR
ncbi:MAG: beta-lactamase family protein [Lachnospiraceae bacterium]|nr:beta-lactamase family protein [Lachnospiraceae bacterium]